ncbi:hypothetical protein HUJ04_006302 [Dendroctonus ponderosae]|nr:hypothetical protein HUJ04_006302 [Dendroctonus ponderosae]
MVRIFRDLVPSWAEGGYELGVWEYVSDLVKSYQTVQSPDQPSDQQHCPDYRNHSEEKQYEENAVYYELLCGLRRRSPMEPVFSITPMSRFVKRRIVHHVNRQANQIGSTSSKNRKPNLNHLNPTNVMVPDGVISVKPWFFSRALSQPNVTCLRFFHAEVNCAVAATVMDKTWNNLLWGDFKILTVILDKMASLPLSRSSTYSSSDSESSDDLLPASCSLQEIRQEDLAAILPDQNECNDFNDFDENNKDSPATGDMSGSDMELPQQAINSLIQRTTESSSDGEGHQLPNPQTLFANSLLQQFVPNSPLVGPNGNSHLAVSIGESLSAGATSSGAAGAHAMSSKSSDHASSALNCEVSADAPSVKRGRGRPRRENGARKHKEDMLKTMRGAGEKGLQDFCGGPNVSPDSGIQNSPDHVSSPEPSLSPNPRLKHSALIKDEQKKSLCSSRRSKLEHLNSRPSSTERHSKRILSQASQERQVKLDERASRRSKMPEAQKAPEVPSQGKPNIIKLNQEKGSARKTSREQRRQLSRNSGSSRASSLEKAKEPVTKVPLTCNQLDRVLCANTDRVLYPPRRKVGRPPIRRPGRPPKHRVETSECKGPSDKPLLPPKGKSRIRLSSNAAQPTKPNANQNKAVSLQVPKILHSKHSQRHKKRKFKIFKSVVSSDPKIHQEIEKLVGDFSKFCVIGSKQTKEAAAEPAVKTLKKVAKKRRTTDYVEKKKRKQSVNATVANSIEQRLPLKKRHYHLVSNGSENQATELGEQEETPAEPQDQSKAKAEKKEKGKEKDCKGLSKCANALKNHTNNNQYEVKVEKEASSHIEEAIEACIHKFSEEKVPKPDDTENKSVMATTPKKRHRLENFQELSSSLPEIKTEVSCSGNEDTLEKLKSSVTVESYINELKIKRNLMAQLPEDNNAAQPEHGEEPKIKKEASATVQVEKTVPVSPESTKKKVRKRRAYNRTGFPTIKRKKKKPISTSNLQATVVDIDDMPICDRVPKEGEEITKFLQRSSRANSSTPDLVRANLEVLDEVSECESLPQDERIDCDEDGDSSRCESVVDNLSDSRNKSDIADSETLSLLEFSIERLKSRLHQKTRKRNRDTRPLAEKANIYPKRRKRECSPASSVEPLLENRLRDSASASGDELSKKSKKAPKWKKKYLPAGLFSDFFKEEESKRQDAAKSSRILAYNAEDHPFGLLPPPYHCGRSLRRKMVDFQLPFDLWWQHTHSQLPGRDLVPSWNYRKIRTNVYNVKTNGGSCEPQSCNCKSTSDCDDDCINRLVLAECPTSHRCNNQRIQKHDWAPGIEKFMTEDKGWGVRTKEPINQGDFILEYVGEVVSDQEFKERMNSIYVNDTHHYCLHLDSGLVIDGHRMGGDGRFVNHSCEPNCEMQKWSVNGQFRMALFALRNIQPFEELSYDYNFSLFNPAEGQPCKCRSAQCRGVIGGKTQRIKQLPESTVPKNPGRVGRPRKTEAKKKPNSQKDNSATSTTVPPITQVVPQIQVKPMSHQQKCFILEHHCFLLRNLTKVRKVRDRSLSVTSNTIARLHTATPTDTSTFINQLNAIQKPRNMKTRKVAQAEDDPELNKTIKLATVLKNILSGLADLKGDKDESLSSHLYQLPSKRKLPEFFQKVQDPIDLSTIEQKVATGVYKTPEAFDMDMIKLFSGFAKFYGRNSDVGIAVAKLKKLYMATKQNNLPKLEGVLGNKPPPAFANCKKTNHEEDIIRCICGIPRDEGLMIQCERCMVWQHIECVKADASVASYHCEVCVPRPIDYEIPMDDFTEHGHRYYMTLMRGDLQLRQGDTVYVLRDIPIPGSDRKHTYETIGKIDYSELDIFRVERLWKDKDSGKRFAYGHHYLRPHETFHEPTRKFFSNEVMRVPLYEAVPVELVMEHCWVMDINTFCKGRPIGAQEEHVYICEYRVDKGAKMFSKVAKSKFPICTKSFAFEQFETRMKISRTYCPHDVDASLLKNGGVGRRRLDKDKEKLSSNEGAAQVAAAQLQSAPVPIQRSPAQQKARLNKILLNLLSKMPTKQIVDVSYLLEGGRRRKKQETKQ